MKDGNWIPVDMRLVNLLPKDREYTFLEAYISLRCDIEKGAPYSVNGYAKMWRWSRNKVRNFVENLRTGKGHSVDTQRTGKGHEIRIVFNNLGKRKDKQGTVEGQSKDSQEDTTIYPNKIIKKQYADSVFMLESEYQKLVADFGEEQAQWMIKKLDSYKGSKGKKYASDYKAIHTWVVKAAATDFKSTEQKRDPNLWY